MQSKCQELPSVSEVFDWCQVFQVLPEIECVICNLFKCDDIPVALHYVMWRRYVT